MMKIFLKLSGVVVILAIAYIGFALFFFDPFEMRVYESKSPKGYGDAVFVDSFSIKDFSTTFYVRDPSGNSKLLTVGDFESDEYPLQEIVWSGDGSVVAVRGMIAPSGRSYGTFFTCAYDFKKHSIVEQSDLSSSVRPLSQKIKQLLKSRGGQRLGKSSEPRAVSGWKWHRREYE